MAGELKDDASSMTEMWMKKMTRWTTRRSKQLKVDIQAGADEMR